MPVTPPTVVDGAPRTPVPYGLFTTFALREAGDRWESGVEWEYDCGSPAVFAQDVCGTATSGTAKSANSKPGVADADPFSIYVEHVCAPVGTTIDQAQDKATALLLAREEKLVEQALWTGTYGGAKVTPSFDTATLNDLQANYGSETVVAIDSWDPAVVLGAVKRQIIRDYGSLGVIHVGPIGATILERYNLIAPKGERMYTTDGWPVAVGNYPEAMLGNLERFPLGPNQIAIVGTPALFGYRSEVFTHDPSMDQGQNELYTIAERTYVIGWDPCVDPVYGLMGVPQDVPIPADGAGVSTLRITDPVDGWVTDNPVFAISGTGATPGADVDLYISDHRKGPAATVTADDEGNFIFDGDSPAKVGTNDWWVLSDGSRSNTVTITVTSRGGGVLTIQRPVPGVDLAPFTSYTAEAKISPVPSAPVEVTFSATWAEEPLGTAMTDPITGVASFMVADGTPKVTKTTEYQAAVTAPGYESPAPVAFTVSPERPEIASPEDGATVTGSGFDVVVHSEFPEGETALLYGVDTPAGTTDSSGVVTFRPKDVPPTVGLQLSVDIDGYVSDIVTIDVE